MSVKKKSRAKAAAFVVDASVTFAWFFEDESSAYADAVADSLATAACLVPVLWYLEVANGLLVGERRKRTTEAKVAKFVRLVSALPITADDQTAAAALKDSLSLARTHHLSAYDAAYLELALRRGLPLATLDGPLRNAMKAAGVALYT
jgi:predicted nucleic acid-binding protein